jgi:hypothetical protein
MMQSKKADPPVPAKVTDATFEPVDQRQPDRGQFWEDGDDPGRHTLRPVSFSGRMFNVGWKGWVRLAIVCTFVGAVFQAGGFSPFAPGFTIGVGFGQIVQGVVNIAGWAAQLGWLPFLMGALVVLPPWLLWRSLVTLVNKDRPPGPHDRILPKERKKRANREQ